MIRNLRAFFRFTAFVILTLTIYSSWWLTSFIVPNKRFWRQTAFKMWCATFVRLSRMNVEVVGKPPSAPFFLVANHLSYTDIPALRMVVNGVFVAKHDIESWVFAGKIVRDMGTIFIDRSNRRDIPRAGQKIVDVLEHGEGVIVFPEGTSTKGESVLHFFILLQVAAAAGPVCYAAISYRTRKRDACKQAVCWWTIQVFLPCTVCFVKEYTATITF